MAENKYNPAYDNKIYQKYAQKTIENKIKNKEPLCEELGFVFNRKVPLIAITYSLKDENNIHMIQDIMNGILEQPVQLVLTSIGTAKYQEYFTNLSEENKNKITITSSDDEEKRKIYAAADIIISPNDNEECKTEVWQAMRYGAIAITPKLDFTEDYNPNTEQGNSFVYLKNSPWSLFANLIRALESFRFPYDWKNIQKKAMKSTSD